MASQLSFCLEEFTCSGCLDLKGMQHSIWWIKSDNEKDLGQFGSHWRKRVYKTIIYLYNLYFLKVFNFRQMFWKWSEHQRMPWARSLGTLWRLQTQRRCCAFLRSESKTITKYGSSKGKNCRTGWSLKRAEAWGQSQIIILSRLDNFFSILMFV